jgi:hypothetical protein
MRSVRYIFSVLLVTGAVLHFTLPRYNATGPRSCVTGEEPLTDLAIVRLYGAGAGDTVSLLAEHPAGSPGAPDSFAVQPDGRPWTYWVTALDHAGNESCMSDPVQLGGGLAVEPAPEGPSVRWYDVTGRRVKHPTTPGVYFWRDGTRSGRSVVLR